MTTRVVERTSPPEVNKTQMVHYAESCCRPGPQRALCGAALLGIDQLTEHLDCAVCAELGADGWYCSDCGAWLS